MPSNCASPSKVTWHNPLFSSFKTASNVSLASTDKASLGISIYLFSNDETSSCLLIGTILNLLLPMNVTFANGWNECYECDSCCWFG